MIYDKYVEEYGVELDRQASQLTFKKEYLQHLLDTEGLTDNSDENKAKVKVDIQALADKVEEIKGQRDWMNVNKT